MMPKPEFLLIEDNLIDQLVIKQLLKKVFNITELSITNDGNEGILWLNNNKKRNQSLVILLDIQMPIMNGFDFLNEFHKLSEDFKRGIQIYVLSSTLDTNEIQEIKNSKYITDFLSKPLSIEEFKTKIYLTI
ncbi:response regulator [Flavobacterium oncorhynchi]|uniref:response regulator n=1 Tax=Flavobacterium oncorhynchi TaxID=728056 RepID=UPI00351A4235